jgi:Isochorismatase family
MRRHSPRRQKRPECLERPLRPHGGARIGLARRRIGGSNLAHLEFDQEITALLVIDPYNDFISEGGKVWDRLKTVAEANNCVPHMLQVLTAARKAGLRVFWNGYLPPAEFVPQLLVAQAQTLLRLQGEPGAAAVYRQVLERFPTSAVAPEAQYSAAVALYKHSHQAPDLLDTWRRLQTQYPSSIWRVKQSFTEQG